MFRYSWLKAPLHRVLQHPDCQITPKRWVGIQCHPLCFSLPTTCLIKHLGDYWEYFKSCLYFLFQTAALPEFYEISK